MALVIRLFLFLALALGLGAAPARAGTPAFEAWRAQVRQEALARGISSATLGRALDPVELDEQVLELDQKQPEHTLTFAHYGRNIVSPRMIRDGKNLLIDNRTELTRISRYYGVPTSVIVALWGIESGFGQNSGDFNLITSLATLAYQGRRAEFFRAELFSALAMIDRERLNPEQLVGSWAGAMGQCQFMPSTYLRYAVDADGDGRRDIWNDPRDAFASIANYLVAEGWQRNVGWGREVRLLHPLPQTHLGLDHPRSIGTWDKWGVRSLQRRHLLQPKREASLVQPDGPDGRAFLVTDNFRALMKWNHSTYFATAVGLLADQIAKP